MSYERLVELGVSPDEAQRLAEDPNPVWMNGVIQSRQTILTKEPNLADCRPHLAMYSTWLKGEPFRPMGELLLTDTHSHCMFINLVDLLDISKKSEKLHRQQAKARGTVVDLLPQSMWPPMRKWMWLKPNFAALLEAGKHPHLKITAARLDTLDAYFDVRHARCDRKPLWDAARNWWASKPPILITKADADAYRDAELRRYNDAK
jgi:hypothetical protein